MARTFNKDTYQQSLFAAFTVSVLTVRKRKKSSHLFMVLVFTLLSCHSLQDSTGAESGDNSGNWRDSDYVFKDKIYDTGIRSVNLRLSDTDVSYPFIQLNGNKTLKMTFDDISGNESGFLFSFVHCNPDWTRSSLSELDYLRGFSQNTVDEVAFGFNSEVSYVNYEFDFPNDFCKFKLSGYYALVLFRQNRPEVPVATLRFVVFEQLVNLTAIVREPTVVSNRFTHQEVDVMISHENYRIDRPYTDLHISILQNGRWDNAITELKPRFVKDKLISYDYGEENLFEGGNEFRVLDLRTLGAARFTLHRFIRENDGHFHAFVRDESNAGKPFSSQPDLNGRFIIKNHEGLEDNTGSSYVFVHFELPYPQPLKGRDVYVAGRFSLYENRSPQKMTYDLEKRAYTAIVLMKQGYYNYQYLVGQKEGRPVMSTMEGSHFGTENEYVTFATNYDITGGGYHRVIGYHVTNNYNK
jgi:hypothetical protein